MWALFFFSFFISKWCVFNPFVCVCLGGGHRSSPNPGSPRSVALAPVGRRHHGSGAGAPVRLHGQQRNRSASPRAATFSVCVLCVSRRRLCLVRACPSPLSAVNNLSKSHAPPALRASLSSPLTTEQHRVCLYKSSARSPATHNRRTVSTRGSGCTAAGFRAV